MGWATEHIAKLKQGQSVQFRPCGNSMAGRINSGQLVTVEPSADAAIGEIVLCSVGGNQYLHIVKARRGSEFLIGNNRGRINGWTAAIYGRVVSIT